MYENVRAVSWGIILSLVFVIATTVVAIMDPFNNGVPWVNWLTISVTAILAVTSSTVLAAMADDEEEFWSGLGIMLGSWLLSAGLIIGLFFIAPPEGLRPEYHSLAWSVLGIPLGVMPIAALVQYLVAARAESKSNAPHLRSAA